jgi:hypothetical protein
MAVIAALALAVGQPIVNGGLSASEAHAAPIPAACVFPTALSPTMEETAWRLFVAAHCPSNGGNVVWENWVEQLQFYPANAGARGALAEKPRRLHGSPLAQALARQKGGGGSTLQLTPNTECSQMNGPPPNVVAKTICEEVHLNPAAAAFITKAGYQVRTAQMKAASAGVDIQFTKPSVEVKVDWIPATDFKPAFTCTSPPSGVHVQMIQGVCYAMAGIHISSKLHNNWVWATFEPQSMLTNPLRCITFGPCQDAWGSSPASSKGGAGGFTKATPNLQALMTQAKLAPEFLNYRLDGVQTEFGTPAKPTLLGNSVIEGENVGMRGGTASCISCHSQSSVAGDGTDQLASLAPTVGTKFQPAKGAILRDFVWSLAFACPDPTMTGAQQCTASSKKK